MIIATWNVNSVRLRLPLILDWLKARNPDVVCLQELKCQNEQFPYTEFEDAGYNVVVHGQKGFNGVAMLSKTPLEDVQIGLPDFDDEQSRYIDAFTNGVRVACIYLPNGNPVETEKYPYKLRFMEALKQRAKTLLTHEEALILAGDYNVIPAAEDCYDVNAWLTDALYLPQTREKFREILHLGFTDSIKAFNKGKGHYTFWDYQAGAFQKNNGIRIDHLLCNAIAMDKVIETGIDKEERENEKPSDHVPAWVRLEV